MFKLTVLIVTIALTAVVALGQAPTLEIRTPDGPNLPADLFYGNVKVKPLRLRPGTTNTLITIDDSDFFVSTNYVDFLNRFPDSGGFAFWNSKFTNCAGNQGCLNNTRIDVSNQFFFVLEYQQTGAYVYRLYRAAFGNNQPFPVQSNSNPTEGNKLPLYANYKADRQQVVGGANLVQQQQDLANAFVLRPEFATKYNQPTLDLFVDAILATIKNELGADLTSQKQQLVALGSRGAVLYRLSDDNASNPIINKPFLDAEYNRAVVYTQYAGYLRRNAEVAGFLFWLNAINAGPLHDLGNQRTMVCNFITSDEYQLRFGSTITHHNSEC